MQLDALSSILFSLLSPPAANLLLLVLGAALLRKKKLIGSSLIFIGIISLYLLSLPTVSSYLIKTTETIQAINTEALKRLQKSGTNRAIVVLAAGRQVKSPEYGEIDTLNARSIERLSYAAWLYRKLGSPILLSGGSPENEATSQAVLMNQMMMSNFDIAPKWIESNSRNIVEQGQFSSLLLEKAQIKEVILITHAQEMPIAMATLENSKLSIIPAPLGFSSTQQLQFSLIPSAHALEQSAIALQMHFNLFWLTQFKLN